MLKILFIFFICVSANANVLYKSFMDKKVFLETNPSYYTINLSTIYYFDGYKDFIRELGTSENVFVFEYGDNKNSLVSKILYGVFKSYKEALITINRLSPRLRNNKPYIAQIGKFQELFKKYHNKKIIEDKHNKDSNKTNIATSIKNYNKKEKRKAINFPIALNEVIKTSPTIIEQELVVKIAKNDIDSAMSGFLPKIDLLYSTGDITDNYDSTSDRLKTSDSKKEITATWNIFNGMNDYNTYKISHIKYRSTVLNKQKVIDNYLYEFILSYSKYLKQREIYKLGDKNLVSYKKYIKKKRLKQKYGMSSMSKTTAFEKKYLTSQLKHIENDKKNLLSALTDLQKYIKIDESTKIDPYFSEIEFDFSLYTNDYVIKIAMENNPKLLQAKNETKLAKKNLSKEYKSFMPTVDFIVKKSETVDTFPDGLDKKGDTSIKLQTKINLFNGGKDYQNIKKNINTYKQKQIQYQNEIIKTKFDVQTSLNEYNNLLNKNNLIKQLLMNADQAYVAAEFDYNYAKLDENALIASMDSLYLAEKQFVNFKYDIINAKFKILFNMGIIQKKLDEIIKDAEVN